MSESRRLRRSLASSFKRGGFGRGERELMSGRLGRGAKFRN